MINWFIIILIILFSVILLKAKKATKAIPDEIRLIDLPVYLEKLQLSKINDAFLIIKKANSDLFIQFTANSTGFQMDFPLILESHRNLEKKFLIIASELGFTVERNNSSDEKKEFLDVNLDGSGLKMHEKTITFIEKLLDIHYGDIVFIESHGI